MECMWPTLPGALVLGLLASCAILGSTAEARANGSTIVVVVESAAERIPPAAIRRALSARLGVPVVSLFDERAQSSRGVLSILIDETGRVATVQFQPRGGRDYAVRVSVDGARAREPEWLVEAAASVVNASDSWATLLMSNDEILDPWAGERPARYAAADPSLLPTDVIDPFGDSSRTQTTEVLDPWASSDRPSRAVGPASRLSPPTPGRPLRPAR